MRPACPRCGDLCPPGSVYCVECGCRLDLGPIRPYDDRMHAAADREAVSPARERDE